MSQYRDDIVFPETLTKQKVLIAMEFLNMTIPFLQSRIQDTNSILFYLGH